MGCIRKGIWYQKCAKQICCGDPMRRQTKCHNNCLWKTEDPIEVCGTPTSGMFWKYLGHVMLSIWHVYVTNYKPVKKKYIWFSLVLTKHADLKDQNPKINEEHVLYSL